MFMLLVQYLFSFFVSYSIHFRFLFPYFISVSHFRILFPFLISVLGGGSEDEEVLRRQIARYHARCSGRHHSVIISIICIIGYNLLNDLA